jgi:hypothetical protein
LFSRMEATKINNKSVSSSSLPIRNVEGDRNEWFIFLFLVRPISLTGKSMKVKMYWQWIHGSEVTSGDWRSRGRGLGQETFMVQSGQTFTSEGVWEPGQWGFISVFSVGTVSQAIISIFPFSLDVSLIKYWLWWCRIKDLVLDDRCSDCPESERTIIASRFIIIHTMGWA